MRAWLRVLLAALVLTSGGVLLQLVSRTEAVPLRRAFDELPLRLGAYRGVDEELEPEVVKTLGATDIVLRRYTADGRSPVWLYAGFYTSQRTGAVIHSPKQCLPGNGWNIVRSERVLLDLSSAALVSRGEDRQLVLYWYQERGRVIADEYWGKAYLVWDSMTRGRSDGALVRLSTPIVATEAATYGALVDFARDVMPLLTEFLPS